MEVSDQHITLRRNRLREGGGGGRPDQRRRWRGKMASPPEADARWTDSQPRPSPLSPETHGTLQPQAVTPRLPRPPLVRTSPMEKEAGRVLAVDMGNPLDIWEIGGLGRRESIQHSRSSEVTLPSNGRLSPPLPRTPDKGCPSSRPNSRRISLSPLRDKRLTGSPGAAQPWTPSSEAHSSLPCSSWQLSPFIRGIRTKLEGFAAIFLSPLRTHLPWGGAQEGSTPPWAPETPPRQPPSSPPPRRASVRLTRSLSCPARSVSVAGNSPYPRPTIGTPPRHRRHTLGGVEPGREADSTQHLLCLRKEVFPGRPRGPRMEGEHSLPEGEEEEEKAESGNSPGCRKVQASPRHSKVRGSPVFNGKEEACGSLKKRRIETVLRNPQEGEISEHRTESSNVAVEMHLGKVSRFRIRKAPGRTNVNLTPLGLPKPARMNKKEFSLEEIYTNKNYKAPADKRTFETIFEEPLTRDGRLVLTSRRRQRRALVFGEGSLPRKGKGRQRRAGGGGSSRLRSRVGAEQVELLLRQRLSELDMLLEWEEEG